MIIPIIWENKSHVPGTTNQPSLGDIIFNNLTLDIGCFLTQKATWLKILLKFQAPFRGDAKSIFISYETNPLRWKKSSLKMSRGQHIQTKTSLQTTPDYHWIGLRENLQESPEEEQVGNVKLEEEVRRRSKDL